MFPARKAGKRAGIRALAIRKALNKCGGSEISYRKTAMFAQISRTLTIGNRRCGLRSLSGMNTESRGQSNQNRQKDKACRMLVNVADRPPFRLTKREISSVFWRNVNLPGNSAFRCGKHCTRVA